MAGFGLGRDSASVGVADPSDRRQTDAGAFEFLGLKALEGLEQPVLGAPVATPRQRPWAPPRRECREGAGPSAGCAQFGVATPTMETKGVDALEAIRLGRLRG